jgi:glycosyltransferase involved in cell wall biosynthesis
MKDPNESSIAIIGAARDVGKFLPKLLKVFEKSFKAFSEVTYFIVENNSIDNTKNVLTQLQREKSNFFTYNLPENVGKIRYKTERIAIARNLAISEVKKIKPDVDYIAVVDLDAINLGLTREAIESCWKHRNWSALFANQPDGYYDIYALRHSIWSPRDFLLDYESLKYDFQ